MSKIGLMYSMNKQGTGKVESKRLFFLDFGDEAIAGV